MSNKSSNEVDILDKKSSRFDLRTGLDCLSVVLNTRFGKIPDELKKHIALIKDIKDFKCVLQHAAGKDLESISSLLKTMYPSPNYNRFWNQIFDKYFYSFLQLCFPSIHAKVNSCTPLPGEWNG